MRQPRLHLKHQTIWHHPRHHLQIVPRLQLRHLLGPAELSHVAEEDFGADADAIRGELFGSDGEEEFVKWVGGDARLPVRDIFCSCFSFHDSTAKMRSIELLAPGTWQRRAAENE